MKFFRRWLIRQVVKGIIEMANTFAQAFDALTAQVQATVGVEASALKFILSVPDLIAAAGTDPAKLADLQAQLKTSADALVAGITQVQGTIAPAPVVVEPPALPPATVAVDIKGTGTVADPANAPAQ